MYSLDKRIKELRKAKKVKQEEIATYLGITYQAYAHYENGRREPSVEMLVKLSDFFDVTIDFLIKGN